MSLKVWIDGKLYDKQDAKISVYDHGLLYGDGVFEGIRVYAGRIFKPDDAWLAKAPKEPKLPKEDRGPPDEDDRIRKGLEKALKGSDTAGLAEAEKTFHRLDRNGDGVLDPSEVVAN